MAETVRANPPNAHRFAKSTIRRSLLRAQTCAVCRELQQQAVYQITVQSKTIVHRLILHVVPSVNFIKLFLRWLLVIRYQLSAIPNVFPMTKFNRREILTAFLGAPFAFAACKRKSENPEVAGEVVGANVNVGHILRENRQPEVPADNWENARVAIVGGGAAGLSAAYKFKKEGFNDFVLLELENKIGGTAQSGTSNIVPYPWGAHYLPVPFQENAELVALLDEMNLTEGRNPAGEIIVREEFLCREPEERVFFKGRWYEGLYLHVGESDEEKRQFAEFQKQVDAWVNWRDAGGKRAFVLPVANCSRDAEVLALDKISFGDWLRQKGFSSERLFWYCDYACRDDYGLKLDRISAWA